MTSAEPISGNSPISCFTGGGDIKREPGNGISGTRAVNSELANEVKEKNINNPLLTTLSDPSDLQDHSSHIAAKYAETGETDSPRSRSAARQRRRRANERDGLKCIPAQWAEAAVVEGLWDLADDFSGDFAAAHEWAIKAALAIKRSNKFPIPVARDAKHRSVLS